MLQTDRIVVSIGTNPTFKVKLTPIEYIPSIPPLSSYIINICLYLAKRLQFFGSRFYKTIALFTQKVRNNNWWRIVKKKKSLTKKVESFWHSWIILVWIKFDFKSRISTNGDYSFNRNVSQPVFATKLIEKKLFFFFFPSREFDLPTLGTVSRRICPQDHGAPPDWEETKLMLKYNDPLCCPSDVNNRGAITPQFTLNYA